MNDATRSEIDKVCWKTLKDAGIVRPPVRIEKVLDFLQLHREFYDLENPGFLDRAKHKIKVHVAGWRVRPSRCRYVEVIPWVH